MNKQSSDCGGGIDVVYDGSERTGELAWRDELAGRDARAIQRKITRLAQLFNEGRARQIDCGNHDQPAPRRRYGSWLPGAEALTFFAPGPLLFLGGNESEYDGWVDNDARMAAEEMETRPQPLSRECQVDWCSGGVTSLYARLFSERRAINGRLGSSVCWVPSKTDGSEGWVGYRVQGNSFSYTVLANPSQEPVAVREHGNVELEPGGFRVLVQDSNMLEQVFKRVVRAGERVKNLRVEADLHSNVLHLHGETRSYYARQCAQHAVMSLRENFSVKDHITSW
ncbi:MAG: hypothetical protein HYR90_00635 [Candidatus Andersenbacteria bacterium]|nr:hypothetical protein [Candidatus Andersenbacteria bacterium]